MIRKITAALMLPAFAALLFVGCGAEADLTEASATWTKKADEVSAALADAQKTYGELSEMHTAMPVADMSDEDKAMYDQGAEMLKAQEATLTSVSETLAAQKEKMMAAVTAGDKEAFDAAWAEAGTAYDEATAKLTDATNVLNGMKEKAAAMHSDDTEAAPADGAAPAEGEAPADGAAPADDKKAAEGDAKGM